MDPIVEQLRNARQAEGISQRALAAAIGTQQSHISDAERGRDGITVGFARRWAEALGYDLTLTRREVS